MKGCILEANLEGQGWQTTLFTILLVLIWGWDVFEKGETSEKGCVEIEDWDTSLHLFISITLLSVHRVKAPPLISLDMFLLA